ncbi:MAG: magnesium transporter CorA family protein [Candidatus Paceibacterota bacterium]
MMERKEYQGTTWVDICQPKYGEIKDLVKEFELDPFTVTELTNQSLKQKVELHSNAIFIVLYVPTFKNRVGSKETVVQEIDFLIGNGFIITIRHDHIDAIVRAKKILEVNSALNKNHLENETLFVFFEIFKEIYNSLTNEVEDINMAINEISKEMFSGKEKQMVYSISYVTRTLLEFKKTIINHKEILTLLERAGKSHFGSFFTDYISAIRAEYGKIEHSLAISKEVITNFHFTNTSLVNTKQNEIMLMLTSVTFLLLPLSFIVSLFFLDTVSRVLPPPPYDLWVLLGTLGAVALFLGSVFKYKGWL